MPIIKIFAFQKDACCLLLPRLICVIDLVQYPMYISKHSFTEMSQTYSEYRENVCINYTLLNASIVMETLVTEHTF